MIGCANRATEEAIIDRFQYLLLMGGCFLITLPLEWIGAGVYRRPARLLRAVSLPVVLFLLWDVGAIARDHWSFDDAFVTGVELPAGLPIEEVVFFAVIPVCAVLTLEAIRRLLPDAAPAVIRPHRRRPTAGRPGGGHA
jgi:lycopene beta-cyclase